MKKNQSLTIDDARSRKEDRERDRTRQKMKLHCYPTLYHYNCIMCRWSNIMPRYLNNEL